MEEYRIPETHRLTDNTELSSSNGRFIFTKQRGYSSSNELLETLADSGLTLPEVENKEGYLYDADSVISVAGFLNSLRVDQRGFEKRRRLAEKIESTMTMLANKSIGIKETSDISHKSLGLTKDFDVVFLPVGIEFTDCSDEPNRARSLGAIASRKIVSSILVAAQGENVRPFEE